MEKKMEMFRNILFVYLFIHITEYCLPGKDYRKYVKFYGGLLVIVLLISPLMEWITKKNWIDEAWNRFSYRQELSGYKYELAAVEADAIASVLAPYKEKITEKIVQLVEAGGLAFESCEIFIETDETKENFGSITALKIWVSKKYGSSGQIQIDPIVTDGGQKQYETAIENVKKEIGNFYNLGLDNINVNMK